MPTCVRALSSTCSLLTVARDPAQTSLQSRRRNTPLLLSTTALSPEMNGPAACNDGFLREDALFVVTLITDEDDRPNPEGSGSPGDPPQWYEHVVAAKGGNAESIVMLSILGNDDPLAGCDPGPRLNAFTELFPNHLAASVCEPNYAPFFEEAVGIVDLACDAFEPEG